MNSINTQKPYNKTLKNIFNVYKLFWLKFGPKGQSHIKKMFYNLSVLAFGFQLPQVTQTSRAVVQDKCHKDIGI